MLSGSIAVYGILHVMMKADHAQQIIVRIIEQPIAYQVAWQWQQDLVVRRSAGEVPDTLLLLEHPPTITLGRSAHRENVLLSPDALAQQGIELVACDRGGDVTYHAPGQLVGYPILKLANYGRRVLGYLRNLEEVMIRALAHYGVEGERREGLTGVWVGAAKIAAIGVRLSASGITSHGFALNVAPELRGFQTIIPCGLHGCGITSLEQLLGQAPPMPAIHSLIIAQFAEVFGIAMEHMPVMHEDQHPYEQGQLI